MSVAPPGKSTIAVWGGETGHEAYEHATQVPVVHSVSFGYPDLDSAARLLAMSYDRLRRGTRGPPDAW